jgi:hypothetical protein
MSLEPISIRWNHLRRHARLVADIHFFLGSHDRKARRGWPGQSPAMTLCFDAIGIGSSGSTPGTMI